MKISKEAAQNEYKYLNDLTLARIRDTNYFWITSMIILTGVCALANELKGWFIVIPGMLSIIPICYALAWNLEGIVRMRTYIACMLEPSTQGGWEKAWSNHPLLTKKKIFAPEVVPGIFIAMYAIMLVYMLMIAKCHWPYGLFFFILIFLPVILWVAYGLRVLYLSFASTTWKEYVKGWEKMENKCKYKVGIIIFIFFLFQSFPTYAQNTIDLNQLSINQKKISVSGISAGAYMAEQLQIVFSKIFSGVGVVSGGFYGCAQDGLDGALKYCMPGKQLEDRYTKSLQLTKKLANKGLIDNTCHLKQDKIVIIYGSDDNVVNPKSSQYTKRYYEHFCDRSNISIIKIDGMKHGMSTLQGPLQCGKIGSPFLYKCGIDSAKIILSTIYGDVKSGKPNMNNLYRFDQKKYSNSNSFDDFGYVYVPKQCLSGNCSLHIVLHGCKQGKEFVGEDFIQYSGFLKYAERNNLILLFPQNKSSKVNPSGCWDWWGYTGSDFYNKKATQLNGIKGMVEDMLHNQVN
ncbi:PHB depolymerase family esterase [Maridesulfovibrio sp.]|uniref:extracellular catalytic domain type 2 short-chain-length polyhydroxyalkanoate depolymerase n=1 Tax=Maridesulfovibrio sp. TaxID=2795000 RepID=UPI002A18A87C|nr:PHB depolymerase family esterase [Maridesulfovibrio sp.]